MNNQLKTSFWGRTLWQSGSVCALCAVLTVPAAAQQRNNNTGSDVNVTNHGTVTLTVDNTDLAQVLEMLAIQSKKNIITSKDVSATVTANLYDVTFEEALDAILSVNGYGYREDGNFIYVYTIEELKRIEDLNRVLETRIFEVDNLSAVDANEYIQPLLSEDGKASYRGEVAAGFKPDVGSGGEDSYSYPVKLVVNDYTENLDAIARLLRDLDTPPQQVLVEAVILQTSLNEDNVFGVDFSVLGSANFTDLTNPVSAVSNLLNGNDAETGFQPADNRAQFVEGSNRGQGAGNLKVGIIQNDVSVFVRILDQVSDTVVLARPKVMCLNRQRAEVLVGSRVGYLSTTATQTSTTQSVEFLDTGIQLVFRPFISKNGMVRLELSPSVSEAELRSITDANGVSVSIPDEVTNEMTTNVRVKDGQTLVLGGLFKDSTTITRSTVPFLGDIPIIGLAFRGQEDKVKRTEVIFMVTPTILQDQTLWEIGEDLDGYASATLAGARSGLLPFSRDAVTANYARDAYEAFAQGKADVALFFANSALHVNPVQPEVIRLREQITGASEAPHVRDILERVMRQKFHGSMESAAIMIGSAHSSPVQPAQTHSAAAPTSWEHEAAWDQVNDAMMLYFGVEDENDVELSGVTGDGSPNH